MRHLYCLRFDTKTLGVSRRFIFDALKAEGIGVNVHYLPYTGCLTIVHAGYENDCCPEANAYYEEAITLPLHCCMGNDDANDVVKRFGK